MVCGCSTQQHSKDSGCRLDNEPGSREFPTSFEGRGTSLDAIQDTASKCQRINIPFTHSLVHSAGHTPTHIYLAAAGCGNHLFNVCRGESHPADVAEGWLVVELLPVVERNRAVERQWQTALELRVACSRVGKARLRGWPRWHNLQRAREVLAVVVGC